MPPDESDSLPTFADPFMGAAAGHMPRPRSAAIPPPIGPRLDERQMVPVIGHVSPDPVPHEPILYGSDARWAELDRPTVQRRTDSPGHLARHVATVSATLSAPIRLERWARAFESGDTAQLTAAIDEAARTVVTSLSAEIGEVERLKERLAQALALTETLLASCEGQAGKEWAWASEKIEELRK